MNDFRECSVITPGNCSLPYKNRAATHKQLDACEKSLTWFLDEFCSHKKYFIKDQFYTESDIKNLCEKITSETPVQFAYSNHTLSIKRKPENEENPYLFLHPTFVQTFQLPIQTNLTLKSNELI